MRDHSECKVISLKCSARYVIREEDEIEASGDQQHTLAWFHHSNRHLLRLCSIAHYFQFHHWFDTQLKSRSVWGQGKIWFLGHWPWPCQWCFHPRGVLWQHPVCFGWDEPHHHKSWNKDQCLEKRRSSQSAYSLLHSHYSSWWRECRGGSRVQISWIQLYHHWPGDTLDLHSDQSHMVSLLLYP